ncbi:hypothetical protein QH494_26235 [Sphingomonas sp. AR_OL41]|uniref:hypothetical protein n=1 Tax=Sphingomonas sp. AR_OL41 TaxID=3042729 RepID=UPI002480ACD9|nr:hypothetical protein [Sphingomonas sp. AR_OL41]MDH7975700.1 hypothetical protein [Sphingomonas sp. AR_OL41]
MAQLSLALSEPQSFLTVGEGESWRLTYTLKSASWLDQVQLATGKNLLELPGKLFVTGMDLGADVEKSIGRLNYLPFQKSSFDDHMPEAYSVEVVVPPARLLELVAAQSAGQYPTDVSVTVEGMTYGSAPDGSHKVWDNSDQRWLPVTALSFEFSPAPAVEERAEEIEPEETQPDPVHGVLNALSATIEARSMWMVCLLGIIAIILLVKL